MCVGVKRFLDSSLINFDPECQFSQINDTKHRETDTSLLSLMETKTKIGDKECEINALLEENISMLSSVDYY